MRASWLFAAVFFLMIAGNARAFEATSTNFEVHAGSIGSTSGTGTSTSFSVTSKIGGLAAGLSSGLTFEEFAGAASLYTFLVGGAEKSATSSVPYAVASSHSFETTKSGNSSQLTFPANFYSESLDLEVDSYSKTSVETTKPAPSGKDFVGKSYDFNLFDSAGGPVRAVNKAVTIVIQYADDDVEGIDETTLVPYRWGSGDSSWQLITGGAIDVVNNQVTFFTTLFSSFAIFGSPAATPETPSGGRTSGGGGGGMSEVTSGVNFSGRAYPLSKVTLLKDGQLAASTVAGPDAKFGISLIGLNPGSYNFAVYGEDKVGRRSSLLTFPISVSYGATAQVSGIFVAPTIAVDKSEVKKGDTIAMFGQTTPGAEVTLQINSVEPLFAKASADGAGAYLYDLDTSFLDLGQHLAKSKSALEDIVSPFGQSVGFRVGTENVPVSQQILPNPRVDLNSDSRVNLIDFSILAYWYKRPLSAEVRTKVDLNGDGTIDLKDFSIMAYWWTG
jgi:hypothetical protein